MALVGRWKLTTTGQGEAPGTGTRGKATPRARPSADDEIQRDASTGGKGPSREISGFCRSWGGRRRRDSVWRTNLFRRAGVEVERPEQESPHLAATNQMEKNRNMAKATVLTPHPMRVRGSGSASV